jgi:hypothetical protein
MLLLKGDQLAKGAGDGPATWTSAPAAAESGQKLVPVFCPDRDAAFVDERGPDRLPRWHLCLDTQTVQAARWPRTTGANTG